MKHDCAKVMELIPVSPQQENLSQDVPRRFTNGFGEEWELEPDRVFPMLKSSDVAKSPFIVRKWMLLPQSRPGEDTADLKERFPKTWKYLCAHEGILKRRKSSVYRNGPDFAVFGIGDYTFAPWKVVISGLYKTMRFALIGPRGQKPVVFDDTCNFLGFPSEQQAAKVHRILASEAVREFLQSFVFPDSKRPFTIQVLQQLNLETLLRLDDDISFMERRAWEP